MSTERVFCVGTPSGEIVTAEGEPKHDGGLLTFYDSQGRVVAAFNHWVWYRVQDKA